MNDPILDLLTSYGTMVSGAAAAIGLIFTAITLHKDGRTREVQIASEIITSLQDLEKQLSDILVEKEKGSLGEEDFKIKSGTWVSVFFAKLDWIAFLFLTGRIKDNNLFDYFKPIFT